MTGGRRTTGALSAIALTLIAASNACLADARNDWVPSWTTAVYGLESESKLPADQVADATLRQTVRLSIGGKRIRIVISNAAGNEALAISGLHVALSGAPGSASIDPRSDHEVRFSGNSNIVILADREATSDPVKFRVPALARLSVTMRFPSLPAMQTGHRRALSSSWITHGDQLGLPTLSSAISVEHWYNLAAVQVEAPGARAIVAVGDSLTDGSRSAVDGNERWPDALAERLQDIPGPTRWSVANQGLAGNQLLADEYGASVLSRFDRDVLNQPNARVVIVLTGSNDLGAFTKTRPSSAQRDEFVRRIEAGYAQLIARAHDRGLRIIGGTLPPFIGSDYDPTSLDDAERQAINQWIISRNHFDGIIDWDTVLRDPSDPSRLKAQFDSGDHIHPSPAGYRAMANAISLSELMK